MGNYDVNSIDCHKNKFLMHKKCGKDKRMTKKATGIIAYITIIGWLIAYLAGDKEGAKFHLNQALVINLALIILNILQWIPVIKYVASICYIVVFVFWILGLVYACQDNEKEVPLLGGIKILK